MPTSGTTFTDWEQVEADRRRPLLVDDDFSWSEPPSRRRRTTESAAKPERKRRVEPEYEVQYEPEPTRVAEQAYRPGRAYEPEPTYAREPVREREPDREPRPRYADEQADGLGRIDVERELDVAWGGRLSASAVDTYEVVPSLHVGDTALTPPGRRTIVITGRGADRFPVGSRRGAEAGLAFHERSGFNPDRMAMWAVLMGIALLLGCIAH
jgi:hypothetical protein